MAHRTRGEHSLGARTGYGMLGWKGILPHSSPYQAVGEVRGGNVQGRVPQPSTGFWRLQTASEGRSLGLPEGDVPSDAQARVPIECCVPETHEMRERRSGPKYSRLQSASASSVSEHLGIRMLGDLPQERIAVESHPNPWPGFQAGGEVYVSVQQRGSAKSEPPASRRLRLSWQAPRIINRAYRSAISTASCA
jgi:hypothetical protein